MDKRNFHHIINLGLRAVIPLVIVVLAVLGAYAMIATKPVARKKPPKVPVPVVNISYLQPQETRIWTPAMGTVEASREVDLEPEVSGKIISVSPSFIPGGFFRKGQEVLRIDPVDYELAVKQQKAVLTEAEYNLKLELGHQKVAGREWKLLGKTSDKSSSGSADLALRKPHLEKARADVESAKAKLRAARINLARTKVKAPFAAQVASRSVDLGAMISSQETLARLVGTEEAWVIASVPVDRLERITFPDEQKGASGSSVRIMSGGAGNLSQRQGEVVRLLPSLEDKGRMARVIVSVKDPFNLQRKKGTPPLLLGSYVKVKIDSGVLEDTYVIDRDAFRDNDTVWIMDDNGTLEVREVKTVWRDENSIYVKEGLNPGERLVLTDISAPLEGMKLRVSKKSEAGEDNG